MQNKDSEWTTVIQSKTKLFDLKLDELWQYRELIWLLVKRNYSTRYKQMILGPLWLIISPLLTILSYTIVFGGIAGLSTDGIPKPVFYLAGNILWSFFAGNVTTNANTFTGNAALFGKIYFPRLIVPISAMITLAIDFLIHFLLLVALMLVYSVAFGVMYDVQWLIMLTPLYILQLGLFGIGVGILISSMTTKYKDLSVFVGFGLQIWMYASPVLYSLTLIPEKYQTIYLLNPVASTILAFKYAYFGIGEFPLTAFIYSWGVTGMVLLGGFLVFNQVEKHFMDTV